tara:strand:- start:2522 stop:2668 length:147 start_codon:yes stop_codon:yes gene_type:complete
MKRNKEKISKELVETYKQYKGLQKGSVAFRNVSRKLQSLSRELEDCKK